MAEWYGYTDIKRKGFNGRGLHLFGLDGERVRDRLRVNNQTEISPPVVFVVSIVVQ